ncbi:hypothetical protein WN943_023299 [Citrus x changshan-huyou]
MAMDYHALVTSHWCYSVSHKDPTTHSHSTSVTSSSNPFACPWGSIPQLPHLANGLHRAEAGSLKLEARRRTYCQQKMEQVLCLPPKRGCIKRRIFSSVYHELKVILHELGFHLLCSCFGNSSSG